MNVKTLISILQKGVKPVDRENANIEIWYDGQEYDIESIGGFSFSPDIVIKLGKIETPALQPLKLKIEHKKKVAEIKKKIRKNIAKPLTASEIRRKLESRLISSSKRGASVDEALIRLLPFK